MGRFFFPSLLVQLGSAVLALWAALLGWRKRQSPGALPFSLLMLAVTTWGVMDVLERLASPEQGVNFFWEGLEFFSASTAGGLYLLFILEFTRQTHLAARKLTWALGILPLYALLSFSAQALGYAPQGALPTFLGNEPPGIISWVYLAYHYILQFTGTALLGWTLLRYPKTFRLQAWSLFLGAALPWLGDIFSQLRPLLNAEPFFAFDLRPVAYALSGIALGWGILRLQLFDIVPIARDTVFDHLNEGVIVLDTHHQVVDINNAALYLLGAEKNVLGRPLAEAFGDFSAEMEKLFSADMPFVDAQHSISKRWLELMALPLTDKNGGRIGKIITLHDITERVETEQALKHSESSLRALFDAAPNPLAVTAIADGRILYANPAAMSVYELTPADIGKRMSTQFYQNPEDRAKIMRLLQEYGWVDDFELGMRTSSGQERWVLNSVRKIFFGGEEALFSSQVDITERRQMEQELRQSRAQLKVIFDHAGVGIRLLDWKGTHTFTNARWAEMLGRSPEAVLGKSESDFLHKSDVPYSRYMFENLLKGEVTDYHMQARYLRQDGSIFWGEVSNTPILDETGNIQSIAGFITDITPQKQTETALRETERRFREILENVYLFAVMLNPQGEIIFVNDYLLKATQWQRNQVLGHSWFEIFTEGIDEKQRKNFLLTLQRGTIASQYESALQTRSGERRLAAWSNILLRDESGAISGMASIGEDITEQKRAQQAEREQRQYAEALNAILSMLTSSLNFEEILDRILENVDKVIPLDAVNISLARRGVAHIVRSKGYEKFGVSDEEIQQVKLSIKKTANLQRMMQTRRPLVVPNVKAYTSWVRVSSADWINSYIGAPIIVDEQVVGFISADNATPNFFNEGHAQRLQAFSVQAAIAIKNARLFEQSHRAQKNLGRANRSLKSELKNNEELRAQLREQTIRDPLTQLYNRRYLEETLQREISRCEREKLPVSVVMLDIDFFKSVNDTYGHAAGDAMLKQLGAMLLNSSRRGDVACRYGGEEFAIVLPGASLEIAWQRAEKWRKQFAETELEFGPFRIGATISLGVACYPKHSLTGAGALAAADQGLYQAKQTGRNRTCLAADYA